MSNRRYPTSTTAVAGTAIALAVCLGVIDGLANGCPEYRGTAHQGAPPDADSSDDADSSERPRPTPLYGLTPAGLQVLATGAGAEDEPSSASMLLPRSLMDGAIQAGEREWQSWQPDLSRRSFNLRVDDRLGRWLTLAPNRDGQREPPAFRTAGWLQRAVVWTAPRTDAADRTDADDRRRCPRASPLNYHCATPSWQWVRWWRMTVRGNEQGCIWAHPMEDRVIHITGPLPKRPGSLEIRTALFDGVVGDGGVVDLTASSGDRRIEQTHPDERGWRSTEPLATDGGDPLHIRVESDSVGRRHFCFDLNWSPRNSNSNDSASKDG